MKNKVNKKDITYTVVNCTIITVDEEDHFYPDGAMVVENGRIKKVGNRNSINPEGTVIDMGGRLVMPGLINTHTHSHASLFRSLGDDMELMDWLHNAMWPAESYMDHEIAYAATRMSCLEYMRGGVTTYADQFYFAEEVARAASESGLRCFLAPSVFTKGTAETDDTFAAAEQFIKGWKGREEETKVYPCIGPHAPYSVDEGLFRKVNRIADEYDLLVHIHISETMDENRQIMEEHRMSPTAWLASMGVLDHRVLAAHSIHLSEQDMELYAKYGVHASYNPVSNLKLVSGIMPMKEMKAAGIQISIGTDGSNSNNSMDLLGDLKTGALIQKMKYRDATFFPAKEAVRMATIEGAKALYIDGETGSLEEGKRADFISLDTKSPRLTPLYRNSVDKIYATVVYSACGADVKDTVVDGEWVVKAGEVLTMDEEVILGQAQEAGEKLVKHVS